MGVEPAAAGMYEGVGGDPEFRAALGFDELRFDSGICTLRWRPRAPWVNTAGTVFGGAIPAILDVVTGLAVLNADPRRPYAVPTVSVQVDYLRPLAVGHAYRVAGTPVRIGRQLAVVRGTIEDEDGALLVQSSVTVAIVLTGPGGRRRT